MYNVFHNFFLNFVSSYTTYIHQILICTKYVLFYRMGCCCSTNNSNMPACSESPLHKQQYLPHHVIDLASWCSNQSPHVLAIQRRST
jgi:hypothetical protein